MFRFAETMGRQSARACLSSCSRLRVGVWLKQWSIDCPFGAQNLLGEDVRCSIRTQPKHTRHTLPYRH